MSEHRKKLLSEAAAKALVGITEALSEVASSEDEAIKIYKAGDAFTVLAMMTRHLAKECATHGTPKEAADGVVRIVHAGSQGIAEATIEAREGKA